MHLSSIPICGLLLIFNLQIFSTYPIGLTDTDMDILKVILNRLEQSVSEQTEAERVPAERLGSEGLNMEEEAAGGQQPQTGLDEAVIRDFFLTKKNERNDSSKRSSSCFNRRMDRIGSMSSLGCNPVGRYNPKST